jgi:hypothetical protein
MKYIILVICALSLPAVALAAHTPDEHQDGKKATVLQKAPIKSEGSCTLDPQKALKMPPFN